MSGRYILTLATLSLLLLVREGKVAEPQPSRLELRLYGVLPADVEVSDAGEASFSKDGSWFATQIASEQIGIFRILPEEPKP